MVFVLLYIIYYTIIYYTYTYIMYYIIHYYYYILLLYTILFFSSDLSSVLPILIFPPNLFFPLLFFSSSFYSLPSFLFLIISSSSHPNPLIQSIRVGVYCWILISPRCLCSVLFCSPLLSLSNIPLPSVNSKYTCRHLDPLIYIPDSSRV